MTPILDRPPIVFADFKMDVNKIETVINSLNRNDLLNKGNPDTVSRRKNNDDRWRRFCG